MERSSEGHNGGGMTKEWVEFLITGGGFQSWGSEAGCSRCTKNQEGRVQRNREKDETVRCYLARRARLDLFVRLVRPMQVGFEMEWEGKGEVRRS